MNKMNKMNKLSASVVVGLSLMFSANVLAVEDEAGDSLISLPVNESTVTTASVNVWFAQIEGAVGYSVDLVGADSNATYTTIGDLACDNTSVNARKYEKRMVISAAGLDCGQEIASTKPGDSTEAGVHLCEWITPNLADGVYALAINPIFSGNTGTVGVAELRTVGTCGGNDVIVASANGTTAPATGGRTNNTAVSTAMTNGTAVLVDASNANYQRFTVVAGAGSATAIPTLPIPLLPAAGTDLPSSDEITFVDNSGANNLATWYELWIYDKNNKRINTFDDNPTFKHWYKNTVDTPELTCTTTNALGNRLCTIDLDGSILATAGTDADGGATTLVGDTVTWWVKGYNSLGATDWSSPATFKIAVP